MKIPISQVIKPEYIHQGVNTFMNELHDMTPHIVSESPKFYSHNMYTTIERHSNQRIEETVCYDTSVEYFSVHVSNDAPKRIVQDFPRRTESMSSLIGTKHQFEVIALIISEIDKMAKLFAEQIVKNPEIFDLKNKNVSPSFWNRTPELRNVYLECQARQYYTGWVITSWLKSLPAPYKSMLALDLNDCFLHQGNFEKYGMLARCGNLDYQHYLTNATFIMDTRKYPFSWYQPLSRQAFRYGRTNDQNDRLHILNNGYMRIIESLIYTANRFQGLFIDKPYDLIRANITERINVFASPDEKEKNYGLELSSRSSSYAKEIRMIHNKIVRPGLKNWFENIVVPDILSAPNCTVTHQQMCNRNQRVKQIRALVKLRRGTAYSWRNRHNEYVANVNIHSRCTKFFWHNVFDMSNIIMLHDKFNQTAQNLSENNEMQDHIDRLRWQLASPTNEIKYYKLPNLSDLQLLLA